MKKTTLLYCIAAVGILLGGCTNKQIEPAPNDNNTLSNEVLVVLSDCSVKEHFINADTNLKFMGEKYDDNDRYISEFRICSINDTSVSVKLVEEFNIDGKSLKKESEEKVQLQECGKGKPAYAMNKKFMVCKRKDGLTQVRVYRNLN